MRGSILTAVLSLTLVATLTGCSMDKSAAVPNRDNSLTDNRSAMERNGVYDGKNDSLTDDMKRAGEKMKNGAENAANDAANGMKNAGNAMKDGVKDMTRDVAEGAKNVGDGMANAVQDLDEPVKNASDKMNRVK